MYIFVLSTFEKITFVINFLNSDNSPTLLIQSSLSYEYSNTFIKMVGIVIKVLFQFKSTMISF